MGFFRGRRLRRNSGVREMVRETILLPQDLVQPYFVLQTEDKGLEVPIESMPGQSQLSPNRLVERVGWAREKGLRSVILFGIPKVKDEQGSGAYAPDGIIQETVQMLKKEFPGLVVITDVCLCEYTSHGHCGLIRKQHVDNDSTLEMLARTAVSHARAGADMVAPSDMMDGRVQAIRRALDDNGYEELPIMSYAVKYSSSFYGPFREAAQSSPQFGDRNSYQMDSANSLEGIREGRADRSEGADILMVKPAMPYLDVLQALRARMDCPLAAYQVSGEYSMIKAAAMQGWLEEKEVVLESLTGIKRAGAEIILSYYSEEVLDWLCGD